MKNNENNSKSSHPTTILIADDDALVRESLREILTYRGYSCLEAGDGKEAISCLSENHIELLLLDLKLPRIDGMEVLKQSLEMYPDLPVIMISGHGTIQLAVEATKMGAYDFLEKPLEAERTLLTIHNALEKIRLKAQCDQLLAESRTRYRMIGADPKMQDVFSLIDRAASVSVKVLITGEAGTGKELVSRAIHFNSPRSAYPFIPVNCSAIPETLIESELFGYVKGAFTGAVVDRQGKFQQAHQGTLFLDEIGDMSLMMQAKVLRVIEDGLIFPVGSHQSVSVYVRIIAATNKNLNYEIEKGNFRSDLYYRLNVIPIHLPPLRERKDDIKPLAEHFLKQIILSEGLSQKTFSNNVWQMLINYDWPGNVRELRNIVEQAAVLTTKSMIEPSLIGKALHKKTTLNSMSRSYKTLREARSKFEKEFILKTLAENDGKIQETADILGIQRSHLWKKMQEYGIKRK